MADYRLEFPDFDPATMPAIPATWSDASHHNDLCPCFLPSPSLCVFIDNVDPAMREATDIARYTVMQMQDGMYMATPTPDLLQSDDWSEVLAFVAAAMGLHTYAIEPQRDTFKGAPEGADGSTWFEVCEEGRAEHWAVFDTTDDLPGPDLVEDYPTREAAEQAIAALLSTPAP